MKRGGEDGRRGRGGGEEKERKGEEEKLGRS